MEYAIMKGRKFQGGHSDVFLVNGAHVGIETHPLVVVKTVSCNFLARKFRGHTLLPELEAMRAFNAIGMGPCVFQVRKLHGNTYIIMEYVKGTSFRQHLVDMYHDGAEATSVRAQSRRVGSLLTNAATNGLIHLDLNPDNIVLCPDGSVRLIDFGLVARTSRHVEAMESMAKDLVGHIDAVIDHMDFLHSDNEDNEDTE
jgi:tRNA A-37 threonylcarbamoyl transferase component Bud32